MSCHCHTRLVRPYSRIARDYDAITGVVDFMRARRAFERLVRTYGIHFRSAVDLGCGTGLFACYLNRRWGVPVFGVDRSPEMLAAARRNCPNLDVCFLLQDFRNFRLPWHVELATANSCTLNHLMDGEQLKQGFRAIHDNLHSGSYLVFDLLTNHQPAHWTQGRTRTWSRRGGSIMHRLRWDPRRNTLSIVITQRSVGTEPPTTEVYLGRGHGLPEVARCLKSAGFFLRGIHDARTIRLASRSSSRVIFVAVRQ